MPLIIQCRYCLRDIDTRGYESHLRRHVSYIIAEFQFNPVVWGFLWATEGIMPPRMPLALPAHLDWCIGTHLSMLAPVEKVRRWV